MASGVQSRVRDMIPTYLGHSYRPGDRDVNRHFLDVFWEEGFAFTVDPKRVLNLSIPHLEFMMLRSAYFVALVPYRANAPLYRTSPYIAWEYQMAVRARKPGLVVAEAQVSGRHFDE